MSQNNPNRQGFYTAHLVDGSKCVAEWKELAKGQGKQWWVYTSEDPTVEKKPTPLKNVVSFTKVSQAEVAEALRREPTVAEKISKSYEETYAQFLRHNSAPPPFPERRRLYLGDEVFVGALQDAKVVALHEGGRVVTVQYKNDSRSSREKGSATIPDLSQHGGLAPLLQEVSAKI
jgi:ribosomal protein L21